jgi:hypothetical protein
VIPCIFSGFISGDFSLWRPPRRRLDPTRFRRLDPAYHTGRCSRSPQTLRPRQAGENGAKGNAIATLSQVQPDKLFLIITGS